MTIVELYLQLKEIGLDDKDIYLNGLHGSTDDNEKLSMIILKGKYSAIWRVYFKERGEQHSVREFNNETDACEYYLIEMKENNK